jgi:hypothetical protein
MSIQDQRKYNLNLLAKEYCGRGSVAEFLGISHSEMTRYYVNENTPLPDIMARKLEDAANKPYGWMDRKNYDLKLTGTEHELLDIYRNSNVENKRLILEMAKLISVRN